jgi:hypothetical protein
MADLYTVCRHLLAGRRDAGIVGVPDPARPCTAAV